MNRNVILVIFLIILSIVSTIISSFLIREEYTSAMLPLKSLNTCNRNIVFPNQVTSKALASSRASPSSLSQISSDPKGVCTNVSTNGAIDSSYSIVMENSIYYTLQKSCLGFRFINSSIDTNNNVYFTFLHDSASDLNNILFFLLLNPLYIEFSPVPTKTTSGYRLTYVSYDSTFKKAMNSFGNPSNFSYSPVYSSSYNGQMSQANDTDFDSSYSSHMNVVDGKKVITLQFSPLITNSQSSCDIAFNYSAQSITLLSQSDLENLKGVINMNVYYLDSIESSFQKPNLTMPLTYDYSQNKLVTSYVYYNDYDSDASPRRSTPLTNNQKSFMNNIRIMYANMIAPTFTITFNISVTKDVFTQSNGSPMTFLEMYVDNGVQYQTCAYANMSGGKNNFNILSVTAGPYTGSSNYYYLYLSTSTKATLDCGINNSSVDTLNIQVPYNSINENTRVVLTVSPQEKILYAEYFSGQSKKTLLGRSKNCPSTTTDYDVCKDTNGTGPLSTVTNDYATIFTNASRATGTTLNDIVLAYNKNIVTLTESVQLGYVNFFKTYVS